MKENKTEDALRARRTEKDRDGRIKHTIQRYSAPMENVSIDNPPLRGISLRLVLLLSSVSRTIFPEEYNSTVLRPESQRAKHGRDEKDGASR